MSERTNNSSENDMIAAAMFMGVVVLILYFAWPYMKEFYLSVKMWQLHLVNMVHPTPSNATLLNKLHEIPAYNWTAGQVAELGKHVNYYFLPLNLLVLYVTGLFCQRRLYYVYRHSNVYNAKQLLEKQKTVWKYLEPIAHLDLLNIDQKVGEWASAKKPQEIALEFNLLNNKSDNESLNRDKSLKYFAHQIGPLYTGLENLSIGHTALIGCFMARIMGDNNEAKYALLDISESFGKEANGKINFKPGLVLFEKYKDEPKIQKLIKQHAYVNTMIARLFEETKRTGVFITKYFLWLKPYDRQLYYTLNNLGREVSWTECGGIIDHYQHEKLLGRPMAKLFIEKAVNGLQEELKRVKLQGET